MPTYEITGPDGKAFEVSAPDGATEAEVMAYAQKNFKMAAAPKPAKAKPFGQQLNDFIGDVPRQVGLTARYGLEGAGDVLDFASSPIRGALNAAGMNIQPGAGRVVADSLGLPSPQTGGERVIGDAAKMLASGGGMVGAASKVAKVASGGTQAVAKALAANPAQQMASAGGAGLAGGYTRETGGGDAAQMLAAVAGGVAAPMAVSSIQGGIGATRNLASRMTGQQAQQQAIKVDVTINNALRENGIDFAELPRNVAQSIRADVAKALDMGGDLSPDAIRRLADYRLTGATPTAGGITLDPAIVTQQKNLAKLGINSKDMAAQQLGRTENANNRTLIAGLNDLGAATTDDAIGGAQRVMAALGARNDRAQGLINGRYAAARATDGRAAALNPRAFTNRAGDMLNAANLESFLTPDIRNKLNAFAGGKVPLNVDIAEQLKTSIGNIQRGSTDGNTRKALGLVRQALDDTPLLDGQDIGQASIDAFNKARRLNRSWMQIVERTPALQAVRDGAEPDKFVQQFIVGKGPKSNVMDVAMLKNSIKGDKEAVAAVKGQIASYLKDRALNGAADEVGNFSNSAFNKALDGIGERKLALFFSKDEIAKFKAVGRVASYEQFQPKGSAVNNSNTASAGLSAMLDRIANSPILSKIPLGKGVIAEPVQNIAIGMQAQKTLDMPRNLLLPKQPQAAKGLLFSPAMFMGQNE